MSNPTTFDSDVTVNKRLFVTDDIVVGSYIATGTTTNYGSVDNKKDTSIGNRLFVQKDAKLNSRLFIESKSYFYNDIQINGKLKCNTLEVTDGFTTTYGINSIPNTAIIGMNNLDRPLGTTRDFTVGGNSTLGGDSTLNKRLFVTQASKFSANAEFMSDMTINGMLNVDNINISGGITQTYTANSIPTYAITNRDTFTTDLYANEKLFVTKTAEFTGPVVMKEDVSMNTNLYIGGTLTVDDLNITGDLALSSFAPNSINANAIIGGTLPSNTLSR